jgi:hypothetical protein
MTHFILDSSGHPVPEPDILRWGRWFESADRTVDRDVIPGDAPGAGITISTVFLGIDHASGMGGGPVLYETMIFGGPNDQAQWRYRTRDEALAGHRHAVAVALIPEGEPPP